MHIGNPNAALPSLRSAIKLDRGYTVKACTDNDFTLYQEQVDSLLEDLRREVMEIAQRRFYEIEADIVNLERIRSEQFHLADVSPIVSVRNILDILDTARKTAHAGTSYGYLDALRVCDPVNSPVDSALQTLRQKHQQQLDQLEEKRRRTEEERRRQEQADLAARMSHSEKVRRRANTAMWISIAGLFCIPLSLAGLSCAPLMLAGLISPPIGIAGFVLGIVSLADVKKSYDQKGKEQAIAAILISLLIFLFYCIAIILISTFR